MQKQIPAQHTSNVKRRRKSFKWERETQYFGDMGGKKEDRQACGRAQRKEDYAGNTHLQKEEWSDEWHSKQNVEE